MKKMSENWVYLFDKYNLSVEEAEKYVTNDPDLSSSEVGQEEFEAHFMVEYLAEQTMFNEYFEMEKKEQIELLGFDPDECYHWEENYYIPIDENDPEQVAKEEERVRSFMGVKLAPSPYVDIEAEKRYEQKKQEKQEEDKAYEQEKLILEETTTADFIRSCHQDIPEDSKNSSDDNSDDSE